MSEPPPNQTQLLFPRLPLEKAGVPKPAVSRRRFDALPWATSPSSPAFSVQQALHTAAGTFLQHPLVSKVAKRFGPQTPLFSCAIFSSWLFPLKRVYLFAS